MTRGEPQLYADSAVKFSCPVCREQTTGFVTTITSYGSGYEDDQDMEVGAIQCVICGETFPVY